MRRCILHLGHAKTATTYLQRALHLNEAVFAARDYSIPSDFSALGSYNFRHIAASGATFSGNLEPVFFAAQAKNYEKVDEILHHIFYQQALPNLILSSELYFYYFWEVRDIILRANDAGFAVDIVVYLQRQDKAAIAAYLQNVRNHGFSGSIIEFLCSCRRWFLCQYAEILGQYQVKGPNRIVARTFEPRFLHEGDILSDFLGATGLPIEKRSLTLPEGRPNAGLSLEGYEIFRELNRSRDLAAIEAFRSKILTIGRYDPKKTMAYYFRNDVREYVLSNYIPDNEILISTYLKDRSPEEQGFWRSIDPAGAGAELDPSTLSEYRPSLSRSGAARE
jgi:hypothetical protein